MFVRRLLLCLSLCAALLLCACGQSAEPAVEPVAEPTPTAAPTPTPAPAPTPTPEPDYPAGDAVTVDGTELGEGRLIDGALCVRLDDFLAAAGIDAETDGETLRFRWRKADVSLDLGSGALLRGETETALGALPLWHGERYVPVESLCGALDISLFYDEEYAHLYCTSAAGDWSVPEGYAVPVFMYHGVSDAIWGEAELFCSPSQIAEQFQWLNDNGYDTIWFSDLEHVEDYDKPILLTFDDGMLNNYTELYPLLEAYQIKATFFIVSSFTDGHDKNYMTAEQVAELAESGLVDIQSHSYSHPELYRLGAAEQEFQLAQSKLDLVRLTGREPYVLCYPRGCENQTTRQLVEAYYRFGVKMGGPLYVTGDDETLIYRFYIRRFFGAATIAELLARNGL